jgi:hexosaminidase
VAQAALGGKDTGRDDPVGADEAACDGRGAETLVLGRRLPAACLRLYSDWAPTDGEAGTLTLTLNSLCDRPLRDFRLAFTSHVHLRPNGLAGADLLERISGYHVLAPPAGFVLTPGSAWSISVRSLNYAPRHYSAGLRSACLILTDGTIVPVAAMPTTCMGDIGIPRLAAPTRRRLPRTASPLSVVPFPRRVDVAGRRDTNGALYLAEATRDARLAFDATAALATRLFPSAPALFGDTGGIACLARHADVPGEGYRIEFGPKAVTLLAAGRTGFAYGYVTLGQILRAAREEPREFTFPLAGEIVDAPRFAWRGMLLDVARQVWRMDDLLRILDGLAWRKVNRLHLHLSDDEGWRLDIPGYPQLAAVAGWRGLGGAIPPLLGSPPGPYGIVYWPAEIAELTRRAEQLSITVVPEIDIPGHSYALLQALPELRDPFETGVYRSFQGFPNNTLNPAVRGVYDFLETVFAELVRVFSSPWIHIGGDEVPKDAWLRSPLAQTLMHEHGWNDGVQMQSHFLRRVQEMLRGLGRRTGAWEEAALGGGIDAGDSYLVAWQNSASGIKLAEQGYDVVLAPAAACYLNMAQSDDWWDPGASWAGTISVESCYAYDPGGDWPKELQARLLGVQACLWSEKLGDRLLFDRMVFPRLSAVAESAWTASACKDIGRFRAMHALMPD